jgi:hypothetical protein
MGEWEIDFKKLSIDLFWWNSKLSNRTSLYHTYERKEFFGVYKVENWKVKIRQKEHISF